MLVLLVTFIAAALGVVWKFGALNWDQIVALGSSILGWSMWTVAIAFAYACLERLFPNTLCPGPAQDATAPRADGA
jgi:hypothetical protein